MKKMQKWYLNTCIDSSVNTPYNVRNTTATLSALRVTRNHGGFLMSENPEVYSYGVTK